MLTRRRELELREELGDEEECRRVDGQDEDAGEGSSGLRSQPLSGRQLLEEEEDEVETEADRRLQRILQRAVVEAVASTHAQPTPPAYREPRFPDRDHETRSRSFIPVPGDPGPYEGGQGFLRWKTYVLRCQRTNAWSPRQLQDRMGQFLDGPAWTTFERLRDAGELPLDAAGMLDAIGQTHCDLQGAVKIAEDNFMRRRQRPAESLYSFIEHFEALAAECRADERFMMRTFLQNVNVDAREALIRRDARSWTELRAAAMLEERVQLSRLQDRPEPSRVHAVHWDEAPEEAWDQAQLAAVQARGGYDRYREPPRWEQPRREQPRWEPPRWDQPQARRREIGQPQAAREALPRVWDPPHQDARRHWEPREPREFPRHEEPPVDQDRRAGAPGYQRAYADHRQPRNFPPPRHDQDHLESGLERKLDRLAGLIMDMAYRGVRQERRQVVCHRCGEEGHIQRNCPEPGNGERAGGAAAPRAQQ